MPPSDGDYDERSGGPERIYPPRLREIEAAAAEDRQRHDQRRRKRLILGVALALLVPAIFLLYGLIDRNVIRPPAERRTTVAPMTVEAGEEIQVGVQNACGRPGVAREVAEYLRTHRFDVPEYGNATETERRTIVIDHVGDSLAARKVAYALDLPPQRIVARVDSSLHLQATVVIGADYHELRSHRAR